MAPGALSVGAQLSFADYPQRTNIVEMFVVNFGRMKGVREVGARQCSCLDLDKSADGGV